MLVEAVEDLFEEEVELPAPRQPARRQPSLVKDPVVVSKPFSPRPTIAPRKSRTAPAVTVPRYLLHWKYKGNDTSDRR